MARISITNCGGIGKTSAPTRRGTEKVKIRAPKKKLDAFLPKGVDASERKLFGMFRWSSVSTPYFDVSRVFSAVPEPTLRNPRNGVIHKIISRIRDIYETRRQNRLVQVVEWIDYMREEESFALPHEREALVLGCSDERWEVHVENGTFMMRDDPQKRWLMMWALHNLGQDRHLRFENLWDDTDFLNNLAYMMNAGFYYPDASSAISETCTEPLVSLVIDCCHYHQVGAPQVKLAAALYLARYFLATKRYRVAETLWSGAALFAESGSMDALEQTYDQLLEDKQLEGSEADLTVLSIVELQKARIVGKRAINMHKNFVPQQGDHASEEIRHHAERSYDLLRSARGRLNALEDDTIKELVQIAGITNLYDIARPLRNVWQVHGPPAPNGVTPLFPTR